MNSFKVGKIYFPKTTATTKIFENLVKAVQNKDMQFTAANNYSIVIKLEYGNNSFIFTGDAEDVSEKEMLSRCIKSSSSGKQILFN